MEQMTEAWIDVPETDGRFQISNKGHLRRIAKKKRLHKETMLVFEIAPVKMVADYKTGMFGWYVYFDNDKHFFERDKLMELFGSIPVALDQEEEREALEVRQQGFNPKLCEEAQRGFRTKSGTWILDLRKSQTDEGDGPKLTYMPDMKVCRKGTHG